MSFFNFLKDNRLFRIAYHASAVEMFLFSIMNIFIYANIINSNYFLTLFFIALAFTLLCRVFRSSVLSATTYVILLSSPILFICNLPTYTYRQAIEKVKYEKPVKIINTTVKNIPAENSLNFIINKAYLIKVEEKSQIKTYIFDAMNGHYVLSEYY